MHVPVGIWPRSTTPTGVSPDAAHFEKRATELGYKPPPRLSNRDY
jgi:hypothetical protein